jgi:CubicO group peptidase (beta-lactamase class C family)
MSQVDFGPTARLLDAAVQRGAFPCAVAEVGTVERPVFQHATGSVSGDPDAARASLDSVFDLASLTKVLATVPLIVGLVERGALSLDEPIGSRIQEWRGRDREHVTVADLLAHRSGLTAHLPFYRDCEGRAEYQHAIATLALEYVPRERAIYSDLGFILLGFILEDVTGEPLAHLYETFASSAQLGDIAFRPPVSWRPRCAPTGVSAWRGRRLAGEVNDDNCWALGGSAGHAGLFGTASAVGRFARRWLEDAAGGERRWIGHATTLSTFSRRGATPDSSRALGWDTMLPSSSCGPLLTATSIGHTGFTGTSLWLDLERGLYFVLLTNRVHPDASNEAIHSVRPAFHSAAAAALSV